jgi:hypothetical protein
MAPYCIGSGLVGDRGFWRAGTHGAEGSAER